MPSRFVASQTSAHGSLPIELGLTKQEFMQAAWLTQFELEVPAVAEFDHDKAVKRLKKCCYANGYMHSPENIGIPLRMTVEEAWFWLRVMREGYVIPKSLKKFKSRKTPSRQEVIQLLYGGIDSKNRSSWFPELVVAVVTFLSPEEILDFIRAACMNLKHLAFSQCGHGFGHFLAGCGMHFTPYLSREKCQKLGEMYIDVLRNDPHLTTDDGLAALAMLAVLGRTDIVTETLRNTKSNIISYSDWIIARVESQVAYEELLLRINPRFNGVYSAKLILAATGVTRLDDIRACLSGRKPDQQRVMNSLRRVLHPGIAPLMLELRSQHKEAAAWLRENALHAAVGLASHAVGADGYTFGAKIFWQDLWRSQADHARHALQYVGDEIKPKLEKLNTSFPSATVLQTSDLLPTELTEVLAELKNRPAASWIAGGVLPNIIVSGVPLSQAQIQSLLHGWKSTKFGGQSSWIGLVKRLADRESLHSFTDHLFAQWQKEGCPIADVWVLMACSLWGSDNFHLRLSRYLVYRQLKSPWPHSRACAGVRALAAAATPVAISQLYRLAQATDDSMQRVEARKMLGIVSESSGGDLELMADANVPTAGFDLSGKRVFEVGGISIESFINDRFELFFFYDGQKSRRLPSYAHKLGEQDFLRLCMECRSARRLLRDTWDLQILRIRQAIAQDYHRSKERFERQILRHPLMVKLAQQVVWQCVPAIGASYTFRPVEDGALIDAQCHTITLPAESRIRLASPASLSEQNVREWIDHFSDHQIIQPVKQFANLACLPLPAEMNEVKVSRFFGAEITAGHLKSLFQQEHWSHDKPHGDGTYARHFRAFPVGQLYACVRHSRVSLLEEGWKKEKLNESPVEIEDVWFIPDHIPKKDWRNSKHYILIRDVPSAIFSEVFSLLHRMTGLPFPQS